jgi:SPP1 gp7 family putative phage head morphogenesis protein
MTRKLFLPVDGYRKWEPPSLSDSFVGKVLELHGRGLSHHETQFVRIQRALFADQHREVMTRIRTELPQFGGPPIRMDEVTARALPLLELFNLGEWAERFRKAAAGFYGTALLFGANQQISAFSLDVMLNTALVQPWLDDRIAFWAQRVNEETAKELIDEITAGIEAKESIQQIQDRVETVFDFADAVRSERIARTETQAVMNHGAVEAYKQSGVVESKMWLATLDARTRDAHLEAHRQTVPLEANFIVMGEAIAHPGDGSPANSIQCRCAVAPIVSRRMWRMAGADVVASLGSGGAS